MWQHGRNTGGGGIGRKTKPVRFPSYSIRALGANTNQRAHATILNRIRIEIESDPTRRVDDLTTREELHGELRNMSNRRNMKSGTTKSASISN
jgi:hypothetical protein